MLLILAGLIGLFAGLCIHGVTWYMRQKLPSLTVALGGLSALGLTGFFLLYIKSDIANIMLGTLAILWGFSLLMGIFQARSLRLPWWKGTAGLFFEMAVAFVAGAAVNLTLQRYLRWFDQNFPGVDVYAAINAFLWTLIATLLLLGGIRPLLWPQASREGEFG